MQHIAQTTKQFHCKWDNWEAGMNCYQNSEQYTGSEFFNEDNGYTEKDIEVINALEIGDKWKCGYGNHSVERIV